LESTLAIGFAAFLLFFVFLLLECWGGAVLVLWLELGLAALGVAGLALPVL